MKIQDRMDKQVRQTWLQITACALQDPIIDPAEQNLAAQMRLMVLPPDVCRQPESWTQCANFKKSRVPSQIVVHCVNCDSVRVCVCVSSRGECVLSGGPAPHAAAEQTGLRHQLRRRRQRLQEGRPTGWAPRVCLTNTHVQTHTIYLVFQCVCGSVLSQLLQHTKISFLNRRCHLCVF